MSELFRDPDTPGRLCTSSPGTLVYTDSQQGNQVAKWLDCSSYPPALTNKRTNIQTGKGLVQDLCCVSHKKNQLLVTTHNHGGVQAYLVGTDKLEWHISGYLPGMNKEINTVGITANGQGELFFCDIGNGCIQALSTEGIFVGTVLRRGEQEFSNPMRIRWCSKTNSLVIADEKRGYFSLSIFKL